jgi:hypothetical protein
MCGPGRSSAPGTAVSSPALPWSPAAVIEQLRGHLDRARQNGLTESELKEMIIHLAFYAGWPRAMSAICLPGSCSTAVTPSEHTPGPEQGRG